MTIQSIELKNLKYHDDMSDETYCFSAVVYVNGEKAFTAENTGKGGCTMFHPIYTPKPEDYSKYQQLLWAAEAYAKSLPNLPCAYFEDGLPMDLDLLVGELVGNVLEGRQMKKLSKNGKETMFRLPDDPPHTYRVIHEPLTEAVERYILKKYPNAEIVKMDDYLPIHRANTDNGTGRQFPPNDAVVA